MKWCKNVKYCLLALLICSVALLSGCFNSHSEVKKYAINPEVELKVDSENDESDELLLERDGEIDTAYLERAKQVFLVDYPKDEKEQLVATRKSLDTSFDSKHIDSITDTGIQKILKNYLQAKGGDPNVAFTPEGIMDESEHFSL